MALSFGSSCSCFVVLSFLLVDSIYSFLFLGDIMKVIKREELKNEDQKWRFAVLCVLKEHGEEVESRGELFVIYISVIFSLFHFYFPTTKEIKVNIQCHK